MRRGDVVLVDPVTGAEADKTRPAVVVGNDASTAAAGRRGHGVVTVVPLTSRTDQVYPFQVLVPAAGTGLRHDSKAQAEQIRSVDVRRIGRVVGSVAPDLLSRIDDALRLHLSL